MLRDWQKQYPGRIESMFGALQNIVPSHLMDSKRHDFKNIRTTGIADPQGDKAFDDEEFMTPSFAAAGGRAVIGISPLTTGV